MKILKYCENYQNVTQRHKENSAVGKMAPKDLFNAELPQTFDMLKNAVPELPWWRSG